MKDNDLISVPSGKTKQRLQVKAQMSNFCAAFSYLVDGSRAKEIKIKLGLLLQKPDSAVDLVIPYNEKPEKPAKIHKPSLDEALQWHHSLDKLLHNNCELRSFY